MSGAGPPPFGFALKVETIAAAPPGATCTSCGDMAEFTVTGTALTGSQRGNEVEFDICSWCKQQEMTSGRMVY